MFVKVKNQNYGSSVATYGDYVVVSNLDVLRWTALSSSVYYTGSVDYFRYNRSTDEHDYINTIYKSYDEIDVILTVIYEKD